MKIQMAGAAIALMSGVLLGGAMQPHLGETRDGPAGPQMLTDVGGVRAEGPGEQGASFVSYRGQTPDYVMGTDWKKSMTWPPESAAVSAPRETFSDETPTPDRRAALTRIAYEEASAPVVVYPSQGGARSVNDAVVQDDTVPAEPDTTY